VSVAAAREFTLPAEMPEGFVRLEVEVRRRWYRLAHCVPIFLDWPPFFLVTVDGDPLGSADAWHPAAQLFEAFLRAAK